MYSGTTLRNHSGQLIGVHQRIDSLARRNLTKCVGDAAGFPSARQILHFEGKNGPDGIKRKSPGVDEPWHFIDPNDPDDRVLINMITEHYRNLVAALQGSNSERAAFEAAWLAHAIVDGLTPAHHYPLGDKIEELWGKPQSERSSRLEKSFIKGSSIRDSLSKNWQYWGAKGVFSTHLLFEAGVASSITTHRFVDTVPSEEEIAAVAAEGLEATFLESAQYVFDLDMYHEFWRKGWTTKLALQTRRELLPIIIWLVTAAWILAYKESQA